MEITGKLQPSMLGDPTVVKSWDANDKRVLPLGVVIGKINGISLRSNPQDESKPAIGFKGIFESHSLVNGATAMRAPILYLPDGITATIIKEMTGGPLPSSKPPRGKPTDTVSSEQLEMLLEVGVRRNTAVTAGYEYVFKFLGDTKKVDPLAELRAKLSVLLTPPAEKKKR